MNVFENEATFDLFDLAGLVRVVDANRFIENLKEALDCGLGVDGHREQETNRVHRPVQNTGRENERRQTTDGQLVVLHQPNADEQRDTECEFRNHREIPPQAGDHAGLDEFGFAQLRSILGEFFGDEAAATESFQNTDAVHALFHRRREVTRLVLALACGDVVVLLEVEADDPQRRDDHQKDAAENPRVGIENAETDDDRDSVGHQKNKTKREPASNQAEVLGGAAEQLPARPAVVKGNRKILQLGIKGSTKVRFDVRSRGQHQPATGKNHERLEHAQAQHPKHQRQDRLDRGLVADCIDDAAQKVRNREGEHVCSERGHHAQHDARQRLFCIRKNAQEGAHRSAFSFGFGHL